MDKNTVFVMLADRYEVGVVLPSYHHMLSIKKHQVFSNMKFITLSLHPVNIFKIFSMSRIGGFLGVVREFF